ncbi:nucleotide exchange factor GrpE [Fluviicola taffensis]|uniref:Protein GrpE n=1 Tax=Fluviicola taffensis (strain DSM 16823 / NCIMB 13979 / RW262) TaxID=755732 RepID=F2ICL8_FLUTR|nr:nucleotide exchange factor GrpE [Fluviicola taffensis]AEA42245.1 Protein grpE [Fluviicola taffensis DSM 16823]
MAEEVVQNEEFNQDANTQNQGNQEEVVNEEVENADNSAGNAGATSTEDQIAALNDKYLRLYSEFDNYRKRTNKEKIELISTASAGVLKDMLSVMDDFERAIANNENSEDISGVKDGFKLIHHKLRNLLEGKGLKQMEAKHQAFDSDLHEAIANVPAPSEDLKGKIVDDVEKGYYLNDKVIRFAKVVVGQ